jgi:hypothetical protein
MDWTLATTFFAVYALFFVAGVMRLRRIKRRSRAEAAVIRSATMEGGASHLRSAPVGQDFLDRLLDDPPKE